MKNAKLFSVLSVLILLVACTAGVLIFGTSAADETVQWTVDGTTYASVKAALTAAEKETWAATQSLVITVDPAKFASESISHDADGNAYPGGIAFGQKTIFRADGTRLPITIQGSSDRTAFTLNITAGTKVACANSYTFKDLTFPIGDSSTSTYFFAGSGIVRLENVATGSGVSGFLGGDNFTARAFDGWTADKIAANAYTESLNEYTSTKILTSLAIGTGVSYQHNAYATRTAAVHDSGGWEAYSGVSLTPADTVAEIVLDGGTVGYFRNRLGNNPVAESIQRVESGTVAGSYFCGAGTYNNSTTYADRAQYTGNLTVIVNGGNINGYVRILHTAQINGNYTIQINGGTFAKYFQCGFHECGVSGDFTLNVTGGNFNDKENGFYAHPSGRVDGKSTVNISGGTFAYMFRGTHGTAYNNEGTAVAHENIEINVMPNAVSRDKDPIFNGDFDGSSGATANNVTVNISGGTFNANYYTSRGTSTKYAHTTVTGGTFNGIFYGGPANAGAHAEVIVNDISGGIFNNSFYGGGRRGNTTTLTNNISGGTFNEVYYGGVYNKGFTVKTLNNNISGGTFKKNLYAGSCMGTVTTLNNKFTGGTLEGNFFGGGYASNCVNVNNTVQKGTFNGSYYGLGRSGETTKVVNTVKGGTFNGLYFGGGNTVTIEDTSTDPATETVYVNTAKAIENNISGGTFDGIYYGGAIIENTGTITNKISGGTFNNLFMGGGKVKNIGNVTNNVTGGTFKSFYLGAGVTSPVTGDVTNNISGGTFAQAVYGGACSAEITGTVTNNLCGDIKFNAGFCGVHGTDAKGGSTGAVVNRVYADENGKAPVFINPATSEFVYNSVTYSIGDSNGFAYLGGSTYGDVLGTITNTVEAGEFGTSSIGMYKGGVRNAKVGKDENGVSIYNYVKGGVFNFLYYAGCLNGTATGETYTEVTGGIFEKDLVGGNRTMTAYDKPITLVIKGGTVYGKVYATYRGYTETQSSRGQVSSTVTLNIEDGTFYGDIYGLGNQGHATSSYPKGSCVVEGGSVIVNLYGGTFYGGVYPTNEEPVEASMTGTAQVNIEPKCGDVLIAGSIASRFAAEKIALKGSTYKVLVDATGSLNATSVEGTVAFEQADKWKDNTYLTLPAGHTATVNVSSAPDAYGYFETKLGENGEILEVYGSALKVGASMILTERIALKFQLSKTAVDAVENFTYSFTLPDGTVLAEGDKNDLKDMMEMTEFEYYTFVLKSLGINQFDTPITVNIKGLWENDTFSISTLAESAVSAWEGNDDFVLMAKAIVNMAKAAKGEALPYTLTPDAVSYERKAPSRDEDALFKASQKSLLMSSAVGLRISGTVASAADAEGLVVKVNGNDVTGLSVIKVEGTDVTVDLYFSAYGMGEEFELQILDKNGKNCLTMLERLDAFANDYGAEHTLAYSLLSYIQATSDMERASFNMEASESEIAYLNSLYANENAYYGDMHGHPGGGIIEDGKVDMSIWVSDRESIGVDFYTAMNHKQVAHMYDDGWDDTVLIGGSEPATTITKGSKKISVHYNMIVPNPEALIEVLQLFPEFNYTGGTGDIAINMGTFGYPKFTYDRFNELVSAIKERGGTVVNVHPKQQWTSDEPLDYYYQDYMGLEVFYSYSDKNIHGKDSQDNYKLWTDLLALGKRVWATAGSDSHGSPVNTGLTTLYSTEALNTKYVEKIVSGNFAPGYVGIRMAIGDVEMGGHTDFEGKKLIFSVGDFHSKYLDNVRAYKVNVITDQGVVYSAVVDGTKTSYFSLDADENAKFYRIEVVDEDQTGLPIVGLGNPIWND